MKPKPFVALNHLTVPVAILLLQDARMREVPARPSRELDPISAMSWGVEPVRRDQQGKSTIRIERRLRRNSQNTKLTRPTHPNPKTNKGHANQSTPLLCSSITT